MSKPETPCQREVKPPGAGGQQHGEKRQVQAQAEKPKAPVISVEGKNIACTGQYPSILECLEGADVEVHYHCRDGFCGACRVILHRGQVIYPQGEPLAFVGEGEILTCCSLPVTDIQIELD
ncbi:class I ribonucleotide reductase maintenance protein YfaE [Thalassomonas actiniarum]|uniref:2Fe-2S iron-sulfur cluster binding domain-containing protein n=1 Tax=Thalassomonas actiniarum TaxID=485447 RepID=A0AAE9YJL5_9GAMM|nr:class I ribonucleotide reductase maintenance protein YfaE [Thalassomonas actiniarum]WDD96852.1 2Fe-2S iron-sulfur cluster binding domain-containing protein [Thalassomonas actiniarum]